jgi:hypothetical protein
MYFIRVVSSCASDAGKIDGGITTARPVTRCRFGTGCSSHSSDSSSGDSLLIDSLVVVDAERLDEDEVMSAR